MRWVADTLRTRSETFTFGVSGTTDSSADLSALLSRTTALVLPMPAAKAGSVLLSENRTVPMQQVLSMLPNGAAIFGGLLPFFELPQHPVFDYGRDEAVLNANAAITAEGAILLALQALPVTLWNNACLVIGYGRIGKALAARLKALGARVAVSARKEADLRAIAESGYIPVHTNRYEAGLSQYCCIFNTVPAPVFGAEEVEQTAPGCLLMDLASAPGGIDSSACTQFARPWIHALSLPGKTAPATAGQIIADYILEHIY